MPTIPGKRSPPLKWLSWLGYLFVLLGLLFFTPATDLLPVDLLSILQPESPRTYLRVVPLRGDAFVIQPAFVVAGACLVLGGIALITIARLGRRRGEP
jgi:hypothetical protein